MKNQPLARPRLTDYEIEEINDRDLPDFRIARDVAPQGPRTAAPGGGSTPSIAVLGQRFGHSADATMPEGPAAADAGPPRVIAVLVRPKASDLAGDVRSVVIDTVRRIVFVAQDYFARQVAI